MTESPMWMRTFLLGCLDKVPSTEEHRLAELAEKQLLPEQNSALKYYEGPVLAACGEKRIAYTFLRKAVSDKYCARGALQSDPLLASVRGEAEFGEIMRAAAECQEKVRAEVAAGK